MRHFTDAELLQLITDDESDRVEFKEALSGSAPEKIREDICAFANDLPSHGEPGFVFVGVKKDKTIVGLPVTDELLRRLADMKTDGNIVPPPSLTVEKRVLGGNEVAVVKVEPSDSPPVRYKSAIHIRIGPRRGTATIQDERKLNEKQRYGDRPFDLYPVPTANISDLNLALFNYEYLPQAVSQEILVQNERTLNEQLAATKMIITADQPTPTVLGILTIGKNPQDFLYGAYVQFLRIDGDELTDEIVDSEEIRGAISDQIRRLDDKLIAHNRVAVDVMSGPVEKRTALYPIEALQQITRNAIMHRTYEGTNAPVRVYWFNNRIDISSPGGAFGGVTADNFGSLGLTDYRNPNLAEAMRTLGFVQHFGMGILIARRLLAENENPAPVFKIYDTAVVATIHIRDSENL
ncbi:putative DNA binding domain-containing protein [Candidatus Poribacteria bacterium]|nr:putative DNA binding domain-containing protein [Candidatus Poribacteria bacterium]